MDQRNSNRNWHVSAGILLRLCVAAVLTWGIMGLSCDQDARAIFRHAVTAPIGEGIKTVLSGDPSAGMGQIFFAGIDGLVDAIDQAGKPVDTE